LSSSHPEPHTTDDADALDVLRAQAADCRACPLWENATQTVFGEGASHALVMLVGEQPGDEEDKTGRPFVGPAGRVLDEALEQAGIDRRAVYVTNAVKHFKWEPRGKRRMHKTPAQQEVAACHQWLEREIATVRPQLLVCLGATAARALLGPRFKITEGRGRFYSADPLPEIFVTWHPSYVLRLRDEARAAAQRQFVEDLHEVSRRLHGS
jgi:uracil-DNA glycosylase family protein